MNPIETMTVQNWVNGDFRRKVQDDEWLKKHLIMIKIGRERGDDSIALMRCFLAAAVCDAAGISIQGNQSN